MLQTLITSKTRIRILVKFFVNVANNGYLRGLAEEFSESTNAIRKELNHLTDAGYLQKEAVQNKITYKANSSHPLFVILQKMVHQHLGLDAMVEMIVERIGAVQKVIVIGDYADGNDSGTIEVVLVGADLNKDYIYQLAEKIKNEIGRKVIFYVRDDFDKTGIVVYEREE